MAAQLSSNPLVISTADVAAADLVIYTGYAKVNHMEYIEYDSVGDSVEVLDTNNRLIWQAKGEDTQDPVWSYFSGWVQGITVPKLKADGSVNLPSGKLLIYID